MRLQRLPEVASLESRPAIISGSAIKVFSKGGTLPILHGGTYFFC